MPPKVTFKQNDVISAGLGIVKENGIQELSARKIAEKLGSSTAPIYSYYSSIEMLKHEVLIEAKKILFQYTMDSYTDELFLNMGVGIVLFAQDYPKLYRAIFLENADYQDIINDFINSLQKELDRDSRLDPLSAEDKRLLLTQMWIFTHGLATLVCVGQMFMKDKKEIIGCLNPMGVAAINYCLQGKVCEEGRD